MNGDVSLLVFIILKALVLFGLGMYIIFSVVIVRQEQLMAQVLEESFEPVLRIATYLHLIASIGLFVFALLLL